MARNHSGKRRGFGLSAFLVLGGLSCPAVAFGEILEGVFFNFESTWISEPESINTTLESWGEDFRSGERQWNFSELEVGFRNRSGLEVSVLKRAMADLRVNKAAAAFYGRIEREEPLNDREVPVQIEVNGLTAQGLRFGYRHELEAYGLEVGGGATVLYTHHLMSGNLDGRFRAYSEDDYDFVAAVDYVYYRDVLFDRPSVDQPSGLGWAFDFHAIWTPNDRLRLALDLKDLGARVEWEDVPFTVAQASTDRKRYDEEGYAEFDPLLTGTEGYYDSFRQKLDPRIAVAAEWNLTPTWGVALEGHRQFEYNRAAFGGTYQGGVLGKVKVLWWPEQQALSIGSRGESWSASLMLDHLEWQKVQALGLTVNYQYR